MSLKASPPPKPPPLRLVIDAGVPEPIIGGALVGLGQDFVGFFGFLEARLGLRVVGIAIGVVLHREAAVRLLDVGLGRITTESEHFVVVPLRHPRPRNSRRARRACSPSVISAASPTRLRIDRPAATLGALLVVLHFLELGIDDVVVTAAPPSPARPAPGCRALLLLTP